MKILFLILCFLTAILYSSEKNDVGKQTTVILDGVNHTTYSFRNSSTDLSFRSRPQTYSFDTSSLSFPIDSSNATLLSGLADLSSETGEPLFLKLAQRSSQNREHGTHGKIKVFIPKTPIRLMAIYRHLGVYTDKLEQFWHEYTQARGGGGINYPETCDAAIARYFIGRWLSEIKSNQIVGTFNTFDEWILLPGLYIPLYRKGNSYTQDIAIPLTSGNLSISGGGIIQQYFPEHIDSISDNNFFIKSRFTHHLSDNSFFTFSGNSSSISPSKHHVSLEFNSSDFEWGSISLNTGLWSGFKPEAKFDILFSHLNNWEIAAKYYYEYSPGEKSMTVVGPKNKYIARHLPTQLNNFHIVISYMKNNQLPLYASSWINYQKSPTKLTLYSNQDTKIVEFSSSKNPIIVSGIEAELKLPWNNTLFSLWGRGNYFIKGKPFESIPYDCGITISYVSPDKRALSVNYRTTWRGPVNWTAHSNGSDTTCISTDILFAELKMRIPFIMPLFSKNIEPSLTFNVGPIPLYPSGRQKFHPFGSLIGPEISVILEGDLLHKRKSAN